MIKGDSLFNDRIKWHPVELFEFNFLLKKSLNDVGQNSQAEKCLTVEKK